MYGFSVFEVVSFSCDMSPSPVSMCTLPVEVAVHAFSVFAVLVEAFSMLCTHRSLLSTYLSLGLCAFTASKFPARRSVMWSADLTFIQLTHHGPYIC